MEWIIVGLIALFLFSRGGNTAAQTASPIQQQGGASLSQALGSQAAPPSHYSSGNPQYNATPDVTAPPSIPIESQVAAPPTTTRTTTAPPRTFTPTQVSNLRRAGEANPSAPTVVQPVTIRTRLAGPEVASAFWTKTPIRVNRPSTY